MQFLSGEIEQRSTKSSTDYIGSKRPEFNVFPIVGGRRYEVPAIVQAGTAALPAALRAKKEPRKSSSD
jgi:hypothetical protein